MVWVLQGIGYIDEERTERFTGKETLTYENGQIGLVCNWVDGLRKGQLTMCWANGNTKLTSYWINGEKDGLEVRYFEEGGVCMCVNWIGGKKDGAQRWFNRKQEQIDYTWWFNEVQVDQEEYERLNLERLIGLELG
jgi:antitoxin component YwqK of YwqJK toxin-antitoxin module